MIAHCSETLEFIHTAIAQTTTFCTQKGIDFGVLESAQGFARTKFWADAVECIIINDASWICPLLLEIIIISQIICNTHLSRHIN